MRQLFISYARENKPEVDELVRDLDALGYQTWVDSHLRGGQTWWEEILRRIVESDVFVAIVSRHTLNSVACKRELKWALALNKPVLPIAVERLPEALPRKLAMRQIVDYSQPGKEAAFDLAGALGTLPAAPPPPDPLPGPPPAPLSYLSDLIDQVSQTGSLTQDQQHQILIQLQLAVQSADTEEREGGRYVLEMFGKRGDLYADVDRSVAQLAAGEGRVEARLKEARRQRDIAAWSAKAGAPWLIGGAAAAALVVVALVTIFFAMNGGEPTARQGGPLSATFAVEFATATRPNGQPYDNAPDGQEKWVIKSACRSDACVATASKVNGSQSTASTLVLDKVGGRWTAVSATSGTCQDAPTEYWESMSLEQRSDGSLEGEYVVRSTTSCARNQHLTFTRTGDVEGDVSIADPEAQPARVASSAQALHGRYQETDTYAADRRTAQASFDIQTYCLRTGQRCLSYWFNPDDVKNMVFSDDKWVLANTTSDAQCTTGDSAKREVTLEYALPQPKQDPITLLTGRGHYTVTGACPFNSDFDSRVQRSGD